MACFHPLKAQRTFRAGKSGVRVLGAVKSDEEWNYLILPCGQCVGCRLERSRQWAVRCVHESMLHDHSVFVTLTYDEEHLRDNFSLRYEDFQAFMRRLRHNVGAVRFFMCGEYGDLNGRPHFHALLFGVFFSDRRFFKRLDSGELLWTSRALSKLWPYGFCSIGNVTFESAAYVARYAVKSEVPGHNGKRQKVTGGMCHYDSETGEVIPFCREFVRMSLKPGIGARWFERFGGNIHGTYQFKRDYVNLQGEEMRVPRYYDKLLEKVDLFQYEYVKHLRELRVDRTDNTVARLAVKEAVTKSRLGFKKRSL